MDESKLREAVRVAEKLVRDEGLSLPIDVASIAAKRDIIVEPKPSSHPGVSGMLIRLGDQYAIGYATHIENEGFQRFSIAHELGHYFLSGHSDSVFVDGQSIHESRAGFTSGNQIELEADHFASGLLMPKQLFLAAAGRCNDGLTAIENLAKKCKASLTACAIRYAQLSSSPLAIIVSSADRVEYCFASDELRELRGYRHPKKGMELPLKSLTRAFNKGIGNIQNARKDCGDTDTMTWFHADKELLASEEVVGLGSYGKTLTVIVVDAPDPDEADEEWEEPGFRRR